MYFQTPILPSTTSPSIALSSFWPPFTSSQIWMPPSGFHVCLLLYRVCFFKDSDRCGAEGSKHVQRRGLIRPQKALLRRDFPFEILLLIQKLQEASVYLRLSWLAAFMHWQLFMVIFKGPSSPIGLNALITASFASGKATIFAPFRYIWVGLIFDSRIRWRSAPWVYAPELDRTRRQSSQRWGLWK